MLSSFLFDKFRNLLSQFKQSKIFQKYEVGLDIHLVLGHSSVKGGKTIYQVYRI